ncbi:DUF262 domain-containing protein [Alteraurantiacibacter aquimixticola]|nr:DUF262 domain-containing protein [Alteraurantiacibacter aquimixticola]
MSDEEFDWVDRDTEFTDDDADESSADLSLSEDKFSGLLIAPADWTIETLYSQIGKQIDLDPDFQRRNVWSAKAKSRFIESLMLGIPIPQILLSSKPGSKSSFLVLDGKQRLLTIKEFIDGRLPNGRHFRLKDLRVLTDLEGKKWDDLKDDPEAAAKLLNETQRTAVLRGWSDESVLYEIFYRLNSGSVKLSPMELRMSLYPGDFLKFILRWSEEIGPVHHLLKKRNPDPRMGDVELAVRFLAFDDNDLTYRGDLKAFLDSLCNNYNSQFENTNFVSDVEGRLDSMDQGIVVGLEAFGENRFCRKFTKGNYETRFNRALFDIFTYSLARPDFRLWASENGETLVAAFEQLSTDDNDFLRSIETTTKSVDATATRFGKWLNLCHQLSDVEIEMPAIAS